MEKNSTIFITCAAVIAVFTLGSCTTQAAEDTPYPSVWQMHHYIYEDYLDAYEVAVSDEAVPYWWAIALSTAALTAVDDRLIQEAQKLGQKWGIQSKDNTKTFVSYQGMDVLRLPTDLGSALYFIGDGWTHSAIAAGFLVAGSWTDNDKTFNVGFALVEGMVTTTIATQFLKHITGHETPNKATAPNGRWRLFPNQWDYAACVACYDAFPSGHLAVGSMTLTVLHKNYPDNPYIIPVGVTLLSALSFQMMNNGVHWASDYPLAIGIGYTFGTIAFERGQRALTKQSMMETAQWYPLLARDGFGVGMQCHF